MRLTESLLRRASYAHSIAYVILLWAAITDREEVIDVMGWVHGVGWIVMSLLCLEAVRRRVIPLWLGVMVAIVGGIGPFAGSFGFWKIRRRRAAVSSAI